MMYKNLKLPAYSIAELAIVLVVIGILAGGIMKGQAMIDNARIKAVVAQIRDYQTAISTFQETFYALPGDFSQAQEVFGKKAVNGNGDGVVSGPSYGTATSEAVAFWAHLAGAKLIPHGASKGNRGTFGYGLPESRLGGGFTVAYNVDESLTGHWLVLGTASGSTGQGGLLTPKQAMQLSKMLEDGDPLTGDVQVRNGQGAGAKCLKADGHYTDSDEKVCTLFVRVPA